MEVFVVGLNHKTTPLELREKLSVPSHRVPEFLRQLKDRQVFDERLLLSTCNRTEIYGAGNGDAEGGVRRAKEYLSEVSRMELASFEDKIYVMRQPESVEHLFAVASGLNSMVIGETEIIGQVKDAYRIAHQEGQTGKVLNTLFQKSLKVAKDLRTQTEIGAGRVSVASVAVDLAEKIFGNLDGARAMVLGTGDMSTQVLKALASRGTRPMIVSSHRFDRAEALAGELGGKAVHFDTYQELMVYADILIASTLAPLTLIREAQVREWMKRRQGRPLFLIDIAVPRNIDASVGKLENVYLYNIDDLQGIAGHNLSLRENQLAECYRLVKRQSGLFMNWLAKEFK